jgi:hypothetical protein
MKGVVHGTEFQHAAVIGYVEHKSARQQKQCVVFAALPIANILHSSL